MMITTVLISTQLAAAEEPGLIVNNTRIITNDRSATFIEGEVSSANGQMLVVKAGLRTISEKKLPNTGGRAKFKIKVPPKNISEKKVTVLYVAEQGAKSPNSKPVRVEINCVERKTQKIRTSKKDYSLTFPGEDVAIKATASSGDKLMYKSSNPDVVRVDADGRLSTVGAGSAEITVKQIGSSAYKRAEETVKVSVKDIDAYSITYHSGTDENDVYKQIIYTGADESLKENTFENEKHEFLGWAPDSDGLMEYLDTADVKDLAKKGENVDLYAVWSGDGARAAIAWAIKIAEDDSFSYGQKPQTSKVGCYFCGTNQRRKPRGYEKTYVCMTFIHAAYAHGAEDPEMYYDCSTGRNCIGETNTNFTNYSCWQKVGLARNLSLSDLEPGDVIVYYAADDYSGHVCMYIGGDEIVDAEGIRDCWGPNSIAVRYNDAAKSLRQAGNSSSQSYVMRYVGPNA
ncbi:MAG: C40 family peptidase [Mogibacterium sp.]|nr:C40 family peptidase [Mogibacterium sp.]